MIPLTKSNYSELEESFVLQAIRSQKLEGDGNFTKKVHEFFEKKYQFKKCFFTTSCTDALELSALLINIQPGDEVIVPSFTFVSSAHAFALRGAKIIFADSRPDHPNVDEKEIEKLITSKTKAVVVVHYAGMGCAMDKIMALSRQHGFYVVEDAAQAIDSFYKNQPLGAIGHLSAFSFHQTKNLSCGEGGLFVVNDSQFQHRAEILREKGTNRQAFFRGEVDKYTCVDIGSSYLGSDLNAALLWGQLQRLEELQARRKKIWQIYHSEFRNLSVGTPVVSNEQAHNAHCYYFVMDHISERTEFIHHLKGQGIGAVFHYQSLHQSPYYQKHHDGRELIHADRYSDCLVRLPLYANMTDEEIELVISSVKKFFKVRPRP